MKSLAKITCLSGFSIVLAIGGCNLQADKTTTNSDPAEAASHDQDEHDHGEHAHPDHGPNGGELIELGMEAYHLEMMHDADGVAFNLLDGTATKPVAIATTTLLASLKHDGDMKQFELKARPRAGEQDGQASCFASANAELAEWMAAQAEGAVVLEIEGKSYTGKIHHDHDRGDHDHGDHDHGDHDAGDHDHGDHDHAH